MIKILVLLVFGLFGMQGYAQTENTDINGWHLLDQETNGKMGISLQKAYDLLKNRKSTPVIVAVIDSGIDTSHEDLQAILWRNEKEIGGNGIDDDGNGYIDDMHGWNFCGSKTGENLTRNTYETARVYHGWKSVFEGKKDKQIPPENKFLFAQWKKAAAIINKDYEEAMKEKEGIIDIKKAIDNSSKIICDYLSKPEFGPGDVKSLTKAGSERLAAAASFWTELFSKADDPNVKNTNYISELADYINQLDNKINRKLQAPEDYRGELTKDRYTDINDRFYGNNDLKTGSNNHGSLVAGTIGAIRNNGAGVDGIADHVSIMAIRAVPGGDEHDKDVALAIRYAVDNGARIINMSFGKPVSPYKQFVDDAVRYAAAKGVLLVHGAGNDGEDISKEIFYPNQYFLDGAKAENYLTVGASGDKILGGYAASFSNYSQKDVDIFAPGVSIYSTAGNNNYESADGTSLACPVVTGVAALLRSYFPSFTPAQIIKIIMASGTSIGEEVVLPGTESKKVQFSTLSKSGKIINAFGAVQYALQLEKEED